MKNSVLIIVFFSASISICFGQTNEVLSLSEAYKLLENNYPILQNEALLDQIYQLDLNNLDIATKPIFQLKAAVRIQSEAPKVGGEGLPININLPFYNFKTYAEANYLIYDGGLNDARKVQKDTRLLANKQAFVVEKYQLKKRINSLFIGVLLNRQQTKLLDITLADLTARREIIAAGVANGVILESEESKIKVRELEIQASKSNLNLAEKGLVKTLEILTGTPLSPTVNLQLPDFPAYHLIPEIKRPEQELFQLQKQALLSNESLITAQRKPKVAAFAQAGLGYPNQLNLFDKNFAPFAIAGINAQWAITDWKKEKNDRELLAIQAQRIDNQKATFEFNVNSATGKYLSDIERLEEQIRINQQIAELQADILKQLAAQLENGVITATDYLIQANAELLARQKLDLYQTQLLQTQLTFLNGRGGETENN